jgi:hypothetical protein
MKVVAEQQDRLQDCKELFQSVSLDLEFNFITGNLEHSNDN